MSEEKKSDRDSHRQANLDRANVVPLGNKLINIPMLNRNRVSIRYVKNTYVKSKNMNRNISNDLKKILMDLIEKKRYDYDDYKKLSNSEKQYLDLLFHFCKINMLGHHYFDEEENNKDIKRFNILKEQILIGNNSTELLKEMKILLFKLKNKGLIHQNTFNSICYQLVILGI
jgi:hypothetical protein